MTGVPAREAKQSFGENVAPMTEDEWRTSTDAYSMLECLGNTISDRKFWLFGAACCRRAWTLLDSADTRSVVETAEQVADGHVSRERLGAVWYQAYRNLISDEDADAAYSLGWGGIIDGKRIFGKSVDQRLGVWFYALNIAWEAADAIARSQGGISCLEELPVDRRNDQARIQVELFKSICRQERPHHAQLIRCVFSSPCRAATLNDAWLTRSVDSACRLFERTYFHDMA